LFEGKAGMAYLLLDMVNPYESRFPAYELWVPGQQIHQSNKSVWCI
jgi:hypothetical protein